MRRALFSIVILAGYVSTGFTQDQVLPRADLAQDSSSDAKELFVESKSFFPENAADSSFSPDVVYNDGPELNEFKEDARKESLKERLRKEAAEEERIQKALLEAKLGLNNSQQPAQSKTLESPQAIISEFGNPDEEPEVKAQDSSPKPYKAMIAALRVGDDKLAYQYAKQYARYVKGVQSNAKRIAGLTGLAMTSEGMLPEDSWALKDTNELDKQFYHEDKLAKASQDAQTDGAVSERAQKLIALVSEDDSTSRINPERGSVAEAELKGFAKDDATQAQYAKKAQVFRDPKGRADVYFFFRPTDSSAAEMAVEMEKVFQAVKHDQKIRFAALTIDDSSDSEKLAFQKGTGISFPIIDGGFIAKDMKVKNSPTVVIAAGSTGEAIFERGKRGASFILQKVRMVKGEL